MAEKQTRAKSRNDQLKQQKRKYFVVTPVFKVRDFVNQSNDEGRAEQRASAKRNESYNHPNACTFNQRGNGSYRRLFARAVHGEVIFTQSEKDVQQQKRKAKRYESQRPKFQNV
jgi:hypothetical protein